MLLQHVEMWLTVAVVYWLDYVGKDKSNTDL